MSYYSGVDVTTSTSVKQHLLKASRDVRGPVCGGSLSWRPRSDIVRLNTSVLHEELMKSIGDTAPKSKFRSGRYSRK